MNLTELATYIRKGGLGFIGAICSMGVVVGIREDKPIIVLASVLVFSLTMVTMQEIKNRETADRGCGNCAELWVERACLGTSDGSACEKWRKGPENV